MDRHRRGLAVLDHLTAANALSAPADTKPIEGKKHVGNEGTGLCELFQDATCTMVAPKWMRQEVVRGLRL
jgi:hypothetical protein